MISTVVPATLSQPEEAAPESVPRHVQNNLCQVGAVISLGPSMPCVGAILLSTLFKMHITPLLLCFRFHFLLLSDNAACKAFKHRPSRALCQFVNFTVCPPIVHLNWKMKAALFEISGHFATAEKKSCYHTAKARIR